MTTPAYDDTQLTRTLSTLFKMIKVCAKTLLFISYLCWLILPNTVFAIDELELSIGSWSFNELNSVNMDVAVTLTSKGLAVTVSADQLTLAAPIGRLNNVYFQCDELRIASAHYSCKKGRLAFQHKDLGQQKIALSIVSNPESTRHQLTVSNIKLAESTLSLIANIKQAGWHIEVNSPDIDLALLLTELAAYLSAEQANSLSIWSIDGRAKLSMMLTGTDEQLMTIEANIEATEINVSDEQGLYVSEALANSMQLSALRTNDDWQWNIESHLNDGQAYAEPIFIDFSAMPLSLKAQGDWLAELGELDVKQLTVMQGDVLKLEGKLLADLATLKSAGFKFESSDLPSFYTTWLQPFVVGSPVDDLELSGSLSAEFTTQGDDYTVQLGLNNIYAYQQAGLFSIDELSGAIAWTNTNTPIRTKIHWQSGSLYAIPLGASTIETEVESSSVRLLSPWNLPLFDGELRLNTFTLNLADDDNMQWQFGGELTPISMELLSTTLQWPLLHGHLSGEIPQVNYANNKVTVDGALKVNLFEGNTVIRDLTLENPFGVLPQLNANISLKGLNLETLTRTFDFGKITGKLDGDIKHLRLSNWQPVQFDASFSTPEGDKSRRRISQKAVDNLSQVGGGPTGILQRSVLRFFEDFSYQKIGLSCLLRNEVCVMSGVEEAEQGYYIVKGGGLPPRINVVGYTRRVDWPDLIERLKAVSENSGPVVID